MPIHFFTPKILGSLLIGAGALSIGGVIYWYQMPRTWRELLTKEGFVFLNDEYDYKGMWNDQKDSNDWSQETELNGAKESDVYDKAKKYCAKLDEKLPESSDLTTKKKFIAFCTFDGIKTVKARLIKNQTKNWLTESDTDKWKVVFAVYRYDTRFIDWLKGDNVEENKNLSKDSSVDEYTKLQTICTKLLNKDYRKVSEEHIRYVSWWCVDPGYTKIKEKIQKDDSTWEVRPKEDNGWSQLKEMWKDTQSVKKWANKAKSQGENSDLTEDTLKELCNSSNIDAQLSDNESYQEKYIVIKTVCKKNNT